MSQSKSTSSSSSSSLQNNNTSSGSLLNKRKQNSDDFLRKPTMWKVTFTDQMNLNEFNLAVEHVFIESKRRAELIEEIKNSENDIIGYIMKIPYYINKETLQNDLPEPIREDIEIQPVGNMTKEARDEFLKFLDDRSAKKQKDEKCYLQNLPNEIILSILENIDFNDLLNLRSLCKRLSHFDYMIEFFQNKKYGCCTVYENKIETIDQYLEITGLYSTLATVPLESTVDDMVNYRKIMNFMRKQFNNFSPIDTFKVIYKTRKEISMAMLIDNFELFIGYGNHAKFVYFEGLKFSDFGVENYQVIRRIGDECDRFRFITMFYATKILILKNCYIWYERSNLWYETNAILVQQDERSLEPMYMSQNVIFF